MCWEGVVEATDGAVPRRLCARPTEDKGMKAQRVSPPPTHPCGCGIGCALRMMLQQAHEPIGAFRAWKAEHTLSLRDDDGRRNIVATKEMA
jgi:hypothetical protein